MKLDGDKLLNEILGGSNGDSANALLSEFFDGYPIGNLSKLLRSSQENAVKVGAWLSSELGERISPLLEDVAKLLDHPSRECRFFALDAVLMGARIGGGDVIARAISLIQDSDPAVRWKALGFLARATKSQFKSSLIYIQDEHVRIHLEWLLGVENGLRSDEITRMLDEGGSLGRMFAAVAAVRSADHDLLPLQHAATSSDDEVREFARDELDILKM